uniref:ANK_REP_REGION domain-containing protein n=1 Tax=Meloidogyne javanica TaxID=6303 RepID=A0A915MW30_MELJA
MKDQLYSESLPSLSNENWVLDEVRFMLTKYNNCVNDPDHADRTALHFAAADVNGEYMIKVLQKAWADAFIVDKYRHTPFYYRTH